jgi:hypothetical protein
MHISVDKQAILHKFFEWMDKKKEIISKFKNWISNPKKFWTSLRGHLEA